MDSQKTRIFMLSAGLLILLCLRVPCLQAQPSREGLPNPYPPPAWAHQALIPSSDAPSWRGRIVSGLFSATLGAGIGYFASQIASSDWENDQGGTRVHRGRWAAAAGAGAFALGFSFPIWGHAPDTGSQNPGPDRFIITGEEIRGASIPDALEAVEHFHPEWLVERGRDTFADLEADPLRVYLDDVPLGETDALQGISSLMIDSIRFLDARQATARWGTGHSHGVIQVITLG